MNILVTAGNTLAPIDRVRSITNNFTGRTGARIALQAHERGHEVTLLTSHPEVVASLRQTALPLGQGTIQEYRTFDELQQRLQAALDGGRVQALVHCAAVSDYKPAGIYAPAPGTCFHESDGRWENRMPEPPRLVDRAAGKVKSDEPELWLRLVRTPKLIDLVRTDWGFQGILVKFKLEVGVGTEQLLEIAERSRRRSAADLMVANTLEGMASWAYLGPLHGSYQRVDREELAQRLVAALEEREQERHHG